MSRPPKVPTAREVRSWPVTVGVVQAGRCWGLGRDAAYDLARAGDYPVPVLRLGHRLVVTRASVLAALGLADPDIPLTSPPSAQVPGSDAVCTSDAREAA